MRNGFFINLVEKHVYVHLLPNVYMRSILKLPQSTTCVGFIVGMGTSLADRACERDLHRELQRAASW